LPLRDAGKDNQRHRKRVGRVIATNRVRKQLTPKPSNTQTETGEAKMAFIAPSSSSSDSVKVADLNGHLLIVSPIEFKANIQTVNGLADAIEVNLIDLDTNEEHNSVLWFNVALKNALKPLIGQKVLGRIGQGIAKPGKNAPWLLLDATADAEAVAKANAYIGGAPAVAVAPAVASANINDPAIQALLAQLGAKTL
jgi:hypothetical protein